MFYVFLFKNFINFDGQMKFLQLYELSRTGLQEKVIEEYDTMNLWTEDERRVFMYFTKVDLDVMIPTSAFPLLFHDKESKMKYVNYPVKDSVNMKYYVDKTTEYIMMLDIEKLFIPPPDILYKIGNQRYNDDGEIKFDYERPSKWSSGFKYQKFLAQPMKPREIWVPGKAIKNNNIFWMIICHQILKKDACYPSTDPEVVYERLKEYIDDIESDLCYFDITAFGFQYVRDILKAASKAIAELYPSTFLTEQTLILHQILDTFDVELDSGLRFHPPRGIGLGYYEDLKTIGMMAILLEHQVVALYGDQGIINESHHVDEKLREHQFILKPDKISWIDNQRIYLGGYTYTSKGFTKPKAFSDAILGAFFSRQHWERKLALRGLYHEFPEKYIKMQKRIAFLYELFFGYEYYSGDNLNNFYDGGVMATQPLIAGYHKLYKVQDMVAPRNSVQIDFKYMIPSVVSRDKTVPDKVAKSFSILRKNTFKSTYRIDDSVYRYARPRLVYNNLKVDLKSPLPGWADALYAAFYNCSSGVITYGLAPDELRLAARRQVYAHNPFEARAKGGYSILTRYRAAHCPEEEMIELAEILANVTIRDLPYATRADLYPHPFEGEDPLYFDSALVEKEHFDLKRKNREAFSEYSGLSDQEYRDLIYKKVKGITNEPEEDLGLLSALLRDHAFDVNDIEHASIDSHGHLEDDDHIYGDDIDDIIANLSD
jgi:hypothetical protein